MIEGALSSSADYVAVIDGDLQHDETRLPVMLEALRTGRHDLVVASRHIEGGDNDGLSNRWRHAVSDGGIWLAQLFLPVPLSDPMSGFFMLPRPLFEEIARNLTGQGFKILLDLVLSAPAPLRVQEVPARFRERVAGESKLDALVMMQFGGLLLDKVFGGLLPLRFMSFAVVGALGVLVHLAVLMLLRETGRWRSRWIRPSPRWLPWCSTSNSTTPSPIGNSACAGPRLWRGLLLFMLVCSVGAVANIGIANVLYEQNTTWTIAGAIGAVWVWSGTTRSRRRWSGARGDPCGASRSRR